MASSKSLVSRNVTVTLDGQAVAVPSERRSFAGIRTHLESLALQQQRILCALCVDGQSVPVSEARRADRPFARMDGETMSLGQVPAQVISAALQQTGEIRVQVQTALELMLINARSWSHERWWNLAMTLKEPLLTLSLVSENHCRLSPGDLKPLHERQFEHLGRVLQEVDDACNAPDPTVLSEALEKRVLPWLDQLQESLRFRLEAILSETAA